MAVINTLVCDLTGTTENVSTHTVIIDGVRYEIDMDKSAFTQTLGKVISKGRRVSNGKTATSDRFYSPKNVRQFAHRAGLNVGARGRLPHTVLLGYLKAGEPVFEEMALTQMRPYPQVVLNAHQAGTTLKSKPSSPAIVKGLTLNPMEPSIIAALNPSAPVLLPA